MVQKSRAIFVSLRADERVWNRNLMIEVFRDDPFRYKIDKPLESSAFCSGCFNLPSSKLFNRYAII